MTSIKKKILISTLVVFLTILSLFVFQIGSLWDRILLTVFLLGAYLVFLLLQGFKASKQSFQDPDPRVALGTYEDLGKTIAYTTEYPVMNQFLRSLVWLLYGKMKEADKEMKPVMKAPLTGALRSYLYAYEGIKELLEGREAHGSQNLTRAGSLQPSKNLFIALGALGDGFQTGQIKQTESMFHKVPLSIRILLAYGLMLQTKEKQPEKAGFYEEFLLRNAPYFVEAYIRKDDEDGNI